MPCRRVDILAVEIDSVVEVWAGRETRRPDAREGCAPLNHITFTHENRVKMEIGGMDPLTMVQYERLPH
jgi:hypothetical protein